MRVRAKTAFVREVEVCGASVRFRVWPECDGVCDVDMHGAVGWWRIAGIKGDRRTSRVMEQAESCATRTWGGTR